MAKRRSVSYGVLVDIRSGSVGVGVVASHQKNKIPDLLYTYREPLRIGTEPSTDERLRALKNALFNALLQLNQVGLERLHEVDPHAHVDRILAVCAAPWSHTLTRLVHLNQDKPFTVTREKLDDLVTQIEEQDVTEVTTTVEGKQSRATLTERAVVHTMLNGYLVHDPYGKKATELTLVHISGLVPNDILTAIADIEKNVIHHATTSVHTYPLVYYCVLRDLYPHTKDALLVDASGEATSVSIMRDHVLYETAMVPIGTHTLMREISGALHTIPDEIRTHLIAYASGTVPENVKVAIDAAVASYREALRGACDKLAQKYVIPEQIFLTTNYAYEPFYSGILQKGSVADTQSTDPVTVTTLGAAEATGLATFTDGTEKDLTLAVLSRFFHKLHGCGELS